jgi:hypothetical protein
MKHTEVDKKSGQKGHISCHAVFLRAAKNVTGGPAGEIFLESEVAGMFPLRVNDLLLRPLKISLEQVVVSAWRIVC